MVVWVPILVAIVTGLVTVITVYFTGRANLALEREKFDSSSKLEQQKVEITSKLERQKFESNLILQAIATGKRGIAQKNLEFLVSAGFLPDPEGKIKELAQRPSDTPVLPARSVPSTEMSRSPSFRWNVRTGSDPDALHVTEKPVPITVEELIAKPRPKGMETLADAEGTYRNQRAEGVERTIYEVEAIVVAWKLQMSGSYHLNLEGKTGQTMIGICVDPQRVGRHSRWAKQISAVRKKIWDKLKPASTYSRGTWPARVRGVGFFNVVHGQSGVAPNGLELTPILDSEWLT